MRVQFKMIVMLIALTAITKPAASLPVPLSGWLAGKAYYFGNPSAQDERVSGACGYGQLSSQDFPFHNMASLSRNSSIALQRSPLHGCGTCLEVEMACSSEEICQAGKSVIVSVTDVCSTRNSTEINLHVHAFSAIANVKVGQAPVRYRQVACEPPENVKVTVSAYRAGAGGWIQLSISRLAGSASVSSVEIRQAPLVEGHLDLVASSWRTMRNAYGAVWEVSGLPSPPLDMRITNNDGQSIIAREVIKEAGKLGAFSTSVQFKVGEPEKAINIDSQIQISSALPALQQDGAKESAASSTGLELNDQNTESSRVSSSAPNSGAQASPAPEAPLNMGGATTSCNRTIMDVLQGDPNFVTLTALIKSADLQGALSDPDGSLTLFAPTNSAILSTVRRASNLKFDIERLQHIILNHLLHQKRDSSSFPTMLTKLDSLDGGNLFAKKSGGQLMLVSNEGSAIATRTDIEACNSIVHAVSGMLLPGSSKKK